MQLSSVSVARTRTRARPQSENFTAPSPDIAQKGGIEFNASYHGTTGPLHSTYPGCVHSIASLEKCITHVYNSIGISSYLLDIVGDWTATLEWIGIDITPE